MKVYLIYLLTFLSLTGVFCNKYAEQQNNKWTRKQQTGNLDICSVPEYTCGPITPTPPKSFYTWLEVTDPSHNSTFYIEEFYNPRANMLATRHTLFNDAILHTIYYYDLDLSVNLIRFKDDVQVPFCRVKKISESTPWLIGAIDVDNHTVSGLSPSQAMLFGADFKYQYVNETKSTRNIPSNEWDTCVINEEYNATLAVKYHWSEPKKVVSMYIGSDERPLAMSLRGDYTEENYEQSIDHSYNFIMFDSNPDFTHLKSAFEIPSNFYCKDLPNLKAPPEELSLHYSMRYENFYYSTYNKEVTMVDNVEVWYDYFHNLVREDYIPRNDNSVEGKLAGENRVTVIQDFNMKIEYVINSNLGNCSIITIPRDEGDIHLGFNNSIEIKNPLELFGLGKHQNVTYYGKKMARGLECDVWVGYLDIKINGSSSEDKYMYEIYLLDDEWKDDTGNGVLNHTGYEPHRNPILMKIQHDITSPNHQKEKVDVYQNIFKFENYALIMDAYDITSCFAPSEKRRFRMSFPSEYRDYFDQQPEVMKSTITLTLPGYIGIPDIRLQKMNLEFSEEMGVLFCEFTITDVPLIEGAIKPSGWTGPPLDKAVEKLKSQMGKITIYLPDGNQYRKMKPYNDSLEEMDGSNCGSKSKEFPNKLPQPISRQFAMEIDKSIIATKLLLDNLDIFDIGDTVKDQLSENSLDSRNLDEYEVPVYLYKERSSSKTFNSGSMAGMGIGMFLVGLIIGTTLMLFALSKLGIKPKIDTIPLTTRNTGNKLS